MVTHFFFHKVQQIPFLPDKGTVHQLWLIRGWLEATGASIHKGPGSPLAPGKTGLGSTGFQEKWLSWYKKEIHLSASLMYEAGHPEPAPCDDLEG